MRVVEDVWTQEQPGPGQWKGEPEPKRSELEPFEPECSVSPPAWERFESERFDPKWSAPSPEKERHESKRSEPERLAPFEPVRSDLKRFALQCLGRWPERVRQRPTQTGSRRSTELTRRRAVAPAVVQSHVSFRAWRGTRPSPLQNPTRAPA